MDKDLKLNKKKLKNTDRKKVKFKHQLLIYLFFLFISVVFWYLNALSKTYYTNLNYSVQYTSFPKGKILVSDVPVSLSLKVKGNGFHLLRYKILSFLRPINLDLKEYNTALHKIDDNYNYFLLTQNILGQLNSTFSSIQVYGAKPDSLFFMFTNVIDKKVAIKPSLDLDFSKAFMQSGKIRVIPDSITISGPKAYLDTLHYIYTKHLSINDIKDTVIKRVELDQLPKFIYPLTKVKLFIPAEKYTEVVYAIPIVAENVPEGMDIKTFPATVNVSFNVTISNFDKMAPNLFKATVYYNTTNENGSQKLKIVLSKSSPLAANIKFYPRSVEYIAVKW